MTRIFQFRPRYGVGGGISAGAQLLQDEVAAHGGQPGQVRPQPLPRSPHKRVLPPTREPGLWAGTAERRLECDPIPVPHAGEDDPHDECADKFPPNRYPGMDVCVGGVRFDALQVGVRVLWEIKTHRFDTYPDFLRERTILSER